VTVTIGSNIGALRAQRELQKESESLSKVFERLSSGQRINRASDDAAGLAIASSLQADSKVFTQAIRNVNDGISTLNVAQGALEAISSITMRQKELAEQAASGSYSRIQRVALTTEANALSEEFNRIVGSIDFNKTKLLDGTFTSLGVQAGYGSSESLSFTLGAEITRAIGVGTFTPTLTISNPLSNGTSIGDVNNDGNNDIVGINSAKAYVLLGNGNGTFKVGVSYATTGTVNSRTPTLSDLNGDGNLDLVYSSQGGAANFGVILGNGDGTFKIGVSYSASPSLVRVADFNGDGRNDVLGFGSASVKIAMNNGDGSFAVSSASFSGGDTTVVLDANGDGKLDFGVTSYTSNYLRLYIGNGDGTFQLGASYAVLAGSIVTGGDVNFDGYDDIVTSSVGSGATTSVWLGNGTGNYAVSSTYSGTGSSGAGTTSTMFDINGDGVLDLLDLNQTTTGVMLGNRDGSFKYRVTDTGFVNTTWSSFGDLTGDGAVEFVTSDGNGMLMSSSDALYTTGTKFLNLSTQTGARNALTYLDSIFTNISSALGTIGSSLSRLEIATKNLQSRNENYQAAGGRIIDADVAQETAELARRQILQKSASAVLAQASQQPEIALKLLGI